MTRLTKTRTQILKRLSANSTLQHAALAYWTKRDEKAVLKAPIGVGAAKWKREFLIKDGFAKRGQVHVLPKGGHRVYKGEHITAARITGIPVNEHLDISRTSTPSVWAYQDILPDTMYAIPVLEQVPVAAPFDPRTVAMENTVAVFGPRRDLVDVPFDIILLSTVYSFFHVIGGRRSYQNKIRGHIYSSAIASLPWNEQIAAGAAELRLIRTVLLMACERRYEQSTKLAADATKLGLRTLRDVVRSRSGNKIEKSETFSDGPEVTISVGPITPIGDQWMLPLDLAGEHTIIFNNQELAELTRAGFRMAEGREVSWNEILGTLVPISVAMKGALEKLYDEYSLPRLDAEINAEIEKLDYIVGAGLGLSSQEVTEIRRDMMEDPFLARVRPRYPFSLPRQYGRRLNLERQDRYST